jgi:rRNA maturation protein Nop10
MTKKKTAIKKERKTEPCTHCGGPVNVTRPSISGLHFCKLPECAAAKVKQYSKRRTSELKATLNSEWHFLLAAILFTEREECPACGLVDALPGFGHLDVNGESCAAMFRHKYPSGQGGKVIATLWPADSVRHRPPA